MLEDYKNALKSGQRAYRGSGGARQSPYLAVLDDILVNVNIVAQGAKALWKSWRKASSAQRPAAVTPPLHRTLCLCWSRTPSLQASGRTPRCAFDEGHSYTPIIAYEFLNKFYVQEGNKRVSVLKYFDAVRIAGTVTRLVPERNDSLENRIYYEFLIFTSSPRSTMCISPVWGGYAKLQTLVCGRQR